MTAPKGAAGLALIVLLGGLPRPRAVGAEGWTLMNPTGHAYSNELVRLKLDWPEGAARDAYRVEADGVPVPHQLEEIDGRQAIWVAATLPADTTHHYVLKRGAPPETAPLVKVTEEPGAWVLDNGLIAVRVPRSAGGDGDSPPGPVQQVRLPDGRWIGECRWQAGNALTNFTAELVADGTVFAKVRLRYAFKGMAGVWGKTPAFARVDIALLPSRRHAVIEEAHEMARGSFWEFDCAAGWNARRAIVVPHGSGFGRPTLKDPDGKPYPWPPAGLQAGQTRMRDCLVNLWPRWSQAYDDGWFFMAHDGQTGVGSLVVRAGKWLWPHNNGIEVKVRESADYAGLRCPTWKGRRYWFLIAGPRQSWGDDAARRRYAMLNAYEALDKLHQEYILDWPGLEAPEGTPPREAADWSSGAGRFAVRSNPFIGWQGAPGAYRKGRHPISLLTRAQTLLDPDTFGSYWLHWSSENPNFATAWNRGGIWGVEKLSGEARYWGGTEIAKHPRYDDLVELARQKLREDMHHSITLPSGAGQECHGYMNHSVNMWGQLRYSCQQMGFDPTEWPYIPAAARFLVHMSYPVGDGTRRSHPGGDTHPPGPNIAHLIDKYGLAVDFEALDTEELRGNGVVFRHHCGTDAESYLAFKSGPNRGHFHGDQLSLHYAPYGMLQAPDHHCSYGPRAGQEHMHNRVAFHTEALPYANMDGYERVIAFKTGQVADVAIGQVESERLRVTTPFPPEQWDWSLPQERFAELLKYRRTVVFVKDGARDYVVLRDQHAGPDVSATYCLHVYGDTCERAGNRFDFDGLQLFVAAPNRFEASRHDWEHHNGGREATKGLRLSAGGAAGQFITVLLPRPRQRLPVMSLSLRGALLKRQRHRGEVDCDVTLMLPWRGNALDVSAPYFLTPGFNRQGRCDGRLSVTEQSEERLALEVTLALPRRRKEPEAVTFRLAVRREGEDCRGTYAGEFRGRERDGAVTGTWRELRLPPMPIFSGEDLPAVEPVPGGVRVGGDEIVFAGGIDDLKETPYVRVRRGGETVLTLTGADIDMDRSQGVIGLFVPDAGYPFGVIPDWLIRQRIRKPEWYKAVWPLTRYRAETAE